MRLIFVLGLLLFSVTSMAEDGPRRFWGDAWRGWHFYEEAEVDELAPATPPEKAPAAPRSRGAKPPPRAPELAEFERLQKALEEARHIAVVRPTETNVRRYMELESKIVSQASIFADVAQRVAWSTPELDPSLHGRPVNARALEVFDRQQMSDRSRTVTDLGKDHVLLFFFRSDCAYCHAFAPILEAFQASHGIKVEAVSVDGGSLPGFSEARRDNGIGTALQVTRVPAIYLAQPFTGRITPIGFGVLSEAQLLERVTAVSSPGYQAMVPSAARQIPRR